MSQKRFEEDGLELIGNLPFHIQESTSEDWEEAKNEAKEMA